MKITFDPEVDSMYIKLSVNKPVKQQLLNDELTADLDEEGNIVGFEIIDATATYGKGLINLDFALLGDLPQQQRYEYSAEDIK